MVTTEMALVLPAMVAAVAGLAWLLALGALQATVAQAAREGARAAARGDSAPEIRAVVRHLVPGAEVTVRRSGGRVAVTARVRPATPMRVLQPLAHEVRATATGWQEGW